MRVQFSLSVQIQFRLIGRTLGFGPKNLGSNPGVGAYISCLNISYMKTCKKCKRILNIKFFYKNKNRVDGLNGFCKNCTNNYGKYWYQRNKIKRQQQIKDYKSKRLQYIKSLKMGNKCFICNENDPICLDFHHLDPKTKKGSLSMAIKSGWSIKKIKEEASKCILLCANCHRKEHKNSFDSLIPDI